MIRVTAAVIRKGDNILIARRAKGQNLAGMWEFPGGKLEDGETPEECLRRELYEEFSIETEIGKLLGSNQHSYPTFDIELEAYAVTLLSGEFTLSVHDEIKWVPLDKLADENLAPADIPLLQYIAPDPVLAYYNERTEEFIQRTVNIDMGSIYERFESLLTGKRILDAACGSGRDSKHFIDQGHDVTAFDASIEIVKAASEHTGLTVEHMSFEDMNWNSEFDGIWASACLLHCINNQLSDVIPRFIKALKPSGIWYMSFKEGEGESRDESGRPFISFTKKSIRTMLERHPEIEITELWTDQSPVQQETTWVNCLVRKP